MTDINRGVLDLGEPHPMAYESQQYISNISADRLLRYAESYASCAMSGNRMAEICGATLSRLLRSEPVSDRYILGLAWSLMLMEKDQKDV